MRSSQKFILTSGVVAAFAVGSLLSASIVSAKVTEPGMPSAATLGPTPASTTQPPVAPGQPPSVAQAPSEAGSHSDSTTLTGSVTLVDKTWVCSGPVSLDSVNVTITGVSKDAVYLRSGCTGRIGTLNVVQYHGDGVHVNNGAHDLVIGGGTIRCFSHDQGKHQDGIQVMGGTNIEFDNLDVGCYSANNSQVWINAGAGGNGTPTDVIFKGGRFQGYSANGQYGPGGSYGIAVVNSIGSGAIGATICPNAHPQRAFYIGSGAINPVNLGNVLPSSCAN